MIDNYGISDDNYYISVWSISLTGCEAFPKIIINLFNIYLKDIIPSSFRTVGDMLIPDLFAAESTTQR